MLLTDTEAQNLLDFLHDLVHGPCGSVEIYHYERTIRSQAEAQILAIATRKLENAGAYSRTIDRWWAGFYTEYRKPTAYETACMTVSDIERTISVSSRRG